MLTGVPGATHSSGAGDWETTSPGGLPVSGEFRAVAKRQAGGGKGRSCVGSGRSDQARHARARPGFGRPDRRKVGEDVPNVPPQVSGDQVLFGEARSPGLAQEAADVRLRHVQSPAELLRCDPLFVQSCAQAHSVPRLIILDREEIAAHLGDADIGPLREQPRNNPDEREKERAETIVGIARRDGDLPSLHEHKDDEGAHHPDEGHEQETPERHSRVPTG